MIYLFIECVLLGETLLTLQNKLKKNTNIQKEILGDKISFQLHFLEFKPDGTSDGISSSTSPVTPC